MIEGAVSGHRHILSLEQHRLSSRRDAPKQSQILVSQRAAGRIVPELQEPAVHFTDAIGELEPGIAGEAIGPVGRRVHVKDIAPLAINC
jgi:hypothetical protein